MKYEWKKQDRELYLPKRKPEIVTVPSMKFFMLDGRGNRLRRVSKTHREIYISDFRKTVSEKLKTVLRFKTECV